MSPQAQARSGVKAQAMLAEMPLNELRQARGLSEKMLAEVLHVQQPSIANLELGELTLPRPGSFEPLIRVCGPYQVET